MIVSALDAYSYAYDYFPKFPWDWKVADNFTWKEVFANEIMTDGTPILEVFENAVQLAKQLQIIRTKLGKPIHVHCWVRQVRKKILEMNLPVRVEANTNGWVHIDIGNSYIKNYTWGLFYP